jgi:cell division septation protein DedD
MRSRVIVAALALSLLTASPAAAETYFVTGTGDTNDPQGCLTPASCPTLRDAVLEAGRNAGQDAISLPVGVIALTAGQLQLTGDVGIVGAGARATTIQAASLSRVFDVEGTVTVSFANMTIAGGAPSSGDGGNILVGTGSHVGLVFARVTGGTAGNGGGIANSGTLTIANSLIDGNHGLSTGGGILNTGNVSAPATTQLVNSTVAANSASEGGGGIRSFGSAQNAVDLLFTTVARNTQGGGISLDVAQDSSADASLISDNFGGNCPIAPISDGSFNLVGVETTPNCGLDPANNVLNVDPQLSPGLVDAGGPTNVFTFPANGRAVDIVNPCPITNDQRNYFRGSTFTQPCDAGAYEQSGTPTEAPVPTPTPEPPVPTPTATPVVTAVPTPTPTATPVTNKSVAADVTGDVRIKDPKTKKFIPLKDGVVPNGSEIDTRKGEIVITTTTPGEKAKFYDGIFKIQQTKKLTTLTMTEELDCKSAKGKARAAAKKPKTRKLWGDGKGKFRTKGQYSAATIRGTKWLVQDTCTTTLTRVVRGVVAVEDFAKKRTILVKQGKRYTARPRA